jgi:DNA-binding response OmpR family regulator
MDQTLAVVIEDDLDLAEIFSEALQAAGFQVETINHGETALSRLKEIVPTIVILDLHLPGVDGRQILKAIRADDRLTSTRVVIASADAAMAGNLQADLVLLKPISFSQLRDLTSRFARGTR